MGKSFDGSQVNHRHSVSRWAELDLDKVTQLISRKLVSGERQMLAQVYLKKGALVPRHSHESEQLTYVLEGRLKVRVADESVVISEGEVIRIPPGVPHQAEALADTFELDLFSPVREEWLEGSSVQEKGR